MSEIHSEFEALVNELHYHSGALVRAGDVVLTLEVCKMQVSVAAPEDGIITYLTGPGEYVSEGQKLAKIQ